jgi:hypothetical protein
MGEGTWVKGPLLNLTDGGLGGPTGWKPTPEIIAKCVESRRKNPRKKGYEVPKNSKRVRSYSSNGELLKIYACARRAADDLQISYKLVSLICLGRRDRTKTPDNQVIRFRFDSDNIDRLPPLEKIQKKQKIVGHVIAKYSLKGELLEIYPSLAEASRKNPGISPSNIWECINGNVKKSKGFIWKRASSSSDIASEVEA